jgi:hypothetical protein
MQPGRNVQNSTSQIYLSNPYHTNNRYKLSQEQNNEKKPAFMQVVLSAYILVPSSCIAKHKSTFIDSSNLEKAVYYVFPLSLDHSPRQKRSRAKAAPALKYP